jgi:hypothetical protein
MKYLALAMLFTFIQATSPAPRETPDTNAGSNQSIQNHSTAQESPSNPSLAVKNADSSKANKQSCNTPTNPNDHVTVIVQPTKTISGWDKAYVIFTGLLVGVGAGGIGYAIKTLKAVERQAKATEDQLIETQNSAFFARKSVMVSERADILLEAASIVPSESTGIIDGDSRLKVRYKNFGRTRATDVRFKLSLEIKGMNLIGAVTQLPVMVLGSGQEQTIGLQTFRECMSEETFKQIANGKMELIFVAYVSYDDVFGDSYATRDAGVFNHRTMRFTVLDKIAG